MTVRMKLVQITPEMAQDWLTYKNPTNRNIIQRKVDEISRDILAGNFLQTGDSIKFDRDGNLVDGQHRLWAVVLAGIPVEVYVVRGLAPETRDVVDTGTKRTLGHAFTINGESNAATLAAVVNLCIKYERDKWTLQEGTTHKEALDWLSEHPDVRMAATIASTAAKAMKIAPAPVGAAYYLNSRADDAAAFEFWQKAMDGANLSPNDAVLAYRRWVMGMLAKRDKPTSRVQFGFALTAMNAWRAGKTVRILTWKHENGLPDLWV